MDNMIFSSRPYVPSEFDLYIQSTLPYVREFYGQTLSMIRRYGNPEGRLLDLGCGTGMLEMLLREAFPALRIEGVDPSTEMLDVAGQKQIPDVVFRQGTSQELRAEEVYDIITAIEVHHFLQPEERKNVISNIFKALKEGGIYIGFENVIPDDDYLKEQELNRWKEFQIAAGKTEEEAELHKKRCGVFYFPITVKEHIRILKETGFRHVYVFWRSHMQMGIFGIKSGKETIVSTDVWKKRLDCVN